MESIGTDNVQANVSKLKQDADICRESAITIDSIRIPIHVSSTFYTGNYAVRLLYNVLHTKDRTTKGANRKSLWCKQSCRVHLLTYNVLRHRPKLHKFQRNTKTTKHSEQKKKNKMGATIVQNKKNVYRSNNIYNVKRQHLTEYKLSDYAIHFSLYLFVDFSLSLSSPQHRRSVFCSLILTMHDSMRHNNFKHFHLQHFCCWCSLFWPPRVFIVSSILQRTAFSLNISTRFLFVRFDRFSLYFM